VYTINLYYNTGHHYYFYPLSTSGNCNEEQINAIYEFYEIDDIDNFDPELSLAWVEGKNKEWLRAKVINKTIYYDISSQKIKMDCFDKDICEEIELKGLLLCIETAIGASEDGLYKIKHRYVSEKEDYKNSYIGENFSINEKNLDLYTLFKNNIFIDENENENENEKNNNLYIKITVKKEDKGKSFGVSLHIDFGNSRTIALRFDKNIKMANAKEQLSFKTRGIYLSDNFKEFYVGSEDSLMLIEKDIFRKNFLVDSWVTLIEPTFNTLNKNLTNQFYQDVDPVSKNFLDKIKKILFKTKKEQELITVKPLMFNENSLANFTIRPPLGNTYQITFDLSSPKRYILDDSTNDDWKMLATDEDDGRSRLNNLSGDYMVLRNITDFTNTDSDKISNLSDGIDGNSMADLSKKEIMILAALKVIEISSRQISSEYYGTSGSREKKYLKDIYVTYPSGWTQKEKLEYQKIWERAKDLYLYSKYKHNLYEHDISINLKMDEAVSSSLPIIFSEIYNINNKINNFFELYGNGEKVRVLSLDIGGGTQDVAIIDYSNETKKLKLDTAVIFADSNRQAGDDLIRQLIKNVLLPHIGKKEENKEKYEKFLKCIDGPEHQAAHTIYLSKIKRDVFLPIIKSWLEDFNIESYKTTKGSTNKTYIEHEDLVQNSIEALKGSFDLIEDNECNEFKECFNIKNKINISYSEIEDEIKRWAEKTLLDFILLYEAFNCDLLIVSGKVSELKPIQEIIKQYFSASLNEIIFTKNYYAGNWLPISNKNHEILDSKLTTVTGSLLLKAIEEKCFGEWDPINVKMKSSDIKYYWYIKDSTGEYTCILNPDDDRYTYNAIQADLEREITIGKSFYQGANVQKMYVLKIPREFDGDVIIKRENELKILKEEGKEKRARVRRGRSKIEETENSDYYDSLTLTQNNRSEAKKVELIVDTLETDKNSYWLDNFMFSNTNR